MRLASHLVGALLRRSAAEYSVHHLLHYQDAGRGLIPEALPVYKLSSAACRAPLHVTHGVGVRFSAYVSSPNILRVVGEGVHCAGASGGCAPSTHSTPPDQVQRPRLTAPAQLYVTHDICVRVSTHDLLSLVVINDQRQQKLTPCALSRGHHAHNHNDYKNYSNDVLCRRHARIHSGLGQQRFAFLSHCCLPRP